MAFRRDVASMHEVEPGLFVAVAARLRWTPGWMTVLSGVLLAATVLAGCAVSVR